MKENTKLTLQIIGLLGGLVVLIPVAMICIYFVSSWISEWNRGCEKGPLESISKCDYQQSSESWMNSGWWHSDAIGELDAASCKIVTDGEDKLPMTEMNGQEAVPTNIYKVSCENFGQSIAGVCYASQRAATNGNSRYVKILIVDGCNNARYFEGSKYTIQDGKVTGYNWGTPIKDIPDEKTGKVEPTQVYGEIPNKTGLYRRG